MRVHGFGLKDALAGSALLALLSLVRGWRFFFLVALVLLLLAFLLVLLLLVLLGILGLHLFVGGGVLFLFPFLVNGEGPGDRRARESHADALVDLDDYAVLQKLHDRSVDAADGNHLVTLAQRRKHVLCFLRLLALRPVQHEVHHDEHEAEDDPQAPGAKAGSRGRLARRARRRQEVCGNQPVHKRRFSPVPSDTKPVKWKLNYHKGWRSLFHSTSRAARLSSSAPTLCEATAALRSLVSFSSWKRLWTVSRWKPRISLAMTR